MIRDHGARPPSTRVSPKRHTWTATPPGAQNHLPQADDFRNVGHSSGYVVPIGLVTGLAAGAAAVGGTGGESKPVENFPIPPILTPTLFLWGASDPACDAGRSTSPCPA